MNKQWLDGMWDHMRQKYGIYLRLLEQIPADRFDDNLVPGMRTPTQMVAHTSGTIVRDIAEGVASGTITGGSEVEDAAVKSLRSKEAVLDFARTCWDRAHKAVGKVEDAALANGVENSWGVPVNGTFAMVVLNEEFLHHRGQLYAYVRACGAEPPFLWSFADNAEEFRPAG